MSAGDEVSPRDLLKQIWSGLLDLVYPPHCVACGRLGEWFCSDCLATLLPLSPPICYRCGMPLGAPGICSSCQARTHLLEGLRSLAFHSGPLRQAIHSLKYEGVRSLADPLGGLLADYWCRYPFAIDVVIPVPLHVSRLRQRGYNQAELLATALCDREGLPLRTDVLVRERNTPSQVGLSRDDRQANVSGAFDCDALAVVGQSVLLIDDVLTTGATLESCADVLLSAGAKEVWALTLARAGGMHDLAAADLDEGPHEMMDLDERRG